MFRIEHPYRSVLLLHECSSVIVYAWEHADKKSLVNCRFHFTAFSVSPADLSMIPSHFCHCCLMESICLKCLHGWLLIGPEVPSAQRPFLSPDPRIIVLDRARLPGQHTLGVWASVGPALALVCPCYTDAVTLWICQGSSCSIKYCIGLRGCVQGLVIL